MKKNKSIPWSNIALVVGLGFAWTKLGLGAAIKEIGIPQVFRKEYPPKTETGYLTFDEFLAQICPACSQLDYQDWLKGQ